jgi:hypothetical protein
MTHEEKMAMRKAIYEHLNILLNKVHKMFSSSNELTVQQMIDASDILKDISKADSAMSKSCYYDSMRGTSDDKKY